jgi:branched-chain amino acid transport system ATP-binding protein
VAETAVLRTRELTRRFGGLVAVKDVSIECRTGEVHAVIGPNGAGKTTLINMLSGDLHPSSGSIFLEGSDVTGLPSHRISRLGVGRSYQKTNVFLPFTAFENCRLAAQSRLASSMRFFRHALADREVNAAAERALAAVGLDGRGSVPVAEL